MRKAIVARLTKNQNLRENNVNKKSVCETKAFSVIIYFVGGMHHDHS